MFAAVQKYYDTVWKDPNLDNLVNLFTDEVTVVFSYTPEDPKQPKNPMTGQIHNTFKGK